MIDSAQLRIGNLVQHYQLPGNKLAYAVVSIPGRVTAIQGKYFTIDHKISSKHSKAEPIPVTPEILLKAGFVDYANNGWGMRLYLNSVDELFWGIQERVVKYQTRGSGFTRDFNIKYVHQLQNLFFALQGTELEINL